MITPTDRSRPRQHFLALSLCLTIAFGITLFVSSAAASPSANAFVQRRAALPLVQIVEPPYDDQTAPIPLRRSSIAFLCAHPMPPPSREIAKLCANLSGFVLVPSTGNDGPQRSILIGPEGIGIGTKRKKHFWSGRIAALEGRTMNSAGGTNGEAGGITTAKRGYDYIRFGRRSSAVVFPSLAKQQWKKSSSGSADARGTYDYIRFG